MSKRLSRLRAQIRALEQQADTVRNPYIAELHRLGQRTQTAKPLKARRRLAKMALHQEESFLKHTRVTSVLKSFFLRGTRKSLC